MKKDKAYIEQCIRDIFEFLGEDPDREGLQGTPDRMVRMWQELFRGYDPEQKPTITTFPNGQDGIKFEDMVVDQGYFHSECEHHMMPFFGKYWFAYIPNPNGRLLGLSKVGRVVDYCAARLQVQERLTNQIIDMLAEALGSENPPLGMALLLRGTHLCKTMRGARKEGKMTTYCTTGVFKTDRNLREEFMAMTKD